MKNFNAVRHAKQYLLISVAILIVGAAMAVFSHGLKLGFDFTGSTLLTVNVKDTYDVAAIQHAVYAAGERDYAVSKASQSDGNDETYALIRLRAKSAEDQEEARKTAIQNQIQSIYPDAAITDTVHVWPSLSMTAVKNALGSVLVACVLLLVYAGIRYRPLQALALVPGLIADAAITLAVVSIFRIRVSGSFIASMLAVIAWSGVNTMSMFHRFDAAKKDQPTKSSKDIAEAVINTSFLHNVCMCLAMILLAGALCIVKSMPLREFTLPIVVGVLASLCSTTFMAGSVWAWADKREKPKTKHSVKKPQPSRA